MRGRNVNLLVFARGCMDEAQAGFQGAGETSATKGESSCTQAVEIGSGAAVGSNAANGDRVGATAYGRRPGSAQTRRSGTAPPTGYGTVRQI